MTDFRALCADLVAIFEKYDDESNLAGIYCDMKSDGNGILDHARAALAEPGSEEDGPTDEELGAFLVGVACQKGDMYYADPLVLARAVLARWGTSNLAKVRSSLGDAPQPESPVEALATRPLLEEVAKLGDVIDKATVGRVLKLANSAEVWLRNNPPGQSIAIEPRGCPAPGACGCVVPALSQPVSVTDRLPGSELCWWFTPECDEEYGWWVLEPDGMERHPQPTHWLPAYALPLPSGEV